VVLPGEDVAEYAALADRLREELEPFGVIEEHLVERIAAHLWRLRRVLTIETGILLSWLERDQGCGDEGVAQLLRRLANTPQASKADDGSPAVAVGRAFVRDSQQADALTKLSYYEARLSRDFARAIALLHTLQASRGMGSVGRNGSRGLSL
jgi:hypothetical protein